MLDMIHHATLVRRNNPDSFEYLSDGLECVRNKYQSLGIDEVREIKHVSNLRPSETSGQVVVISAATVTREAQNALLKLFEEPPLGTKFVLAVPPTLQLLPTLLSRLDNVADDSLSEQSDQTLWRDFINADYASRIKQIETWQKKKDTLWLQSIHQAFTEWCKNNKLKTKNIALVAERLNTRGASNKMLLEMLALELPMQK